jgi:hypothetical protein
MNLKLRIFRTQGIKNLNSGKEIRFAVVNIDSAGYPDNFLCILPRNISYSHRKPASHFDRIFGNNSRKIAIELLTDSLSRELDQEIVMDIEKRLAGLQPKKVQEKKCVVCSRAFVPRKSWKYEAKICNDCMDKTDKFANNH